MTDPSRPNFSKRNQTKSSGRHQRLSGTIGIEVGYGKLQMVRLGQGNDGTIVFEKCRTIDFDPSIDLESPSFASFIKGALKKFCGSAREVGIWTMPPLAQARIHNVKVPQVSPARLPGAVYWALQREESFLEKETVVDFLAEEGSSPKANLSVTGALADRKRIESIQGTFSQAGYPLAGIGLPLFALRNLVNLREEKPPQAPVLVCQPGQRTTSVSVLLDGRIVFTRSIPLGLHNLAESLVKELDPAPSHAEACELVLKLGRGEEQQPEDHDPRRGHILSLLSPVLQRLVRQIERTIEYYQTNFDTEPVEKIFLGGELAARGHLFDFVSEELVPEVIAIDPFEIPNLSTQGAVPERLADRIAYGPAFGLALEGSLGGINLAHTYKDRQTETRVSKVGTAATLVLILLTGVTTFFYHSHRSQLKTLEAEQDKLTKSLQALGPKLTEESITKLTQEVSALQDRRKAATKRYESLALLSEISRLTPDNISLLHLSATMKHSVAQAEDTKTPSTRSKPAGNAPVGEETLLLKGVVTGERTSLETRLTIYVTRLDQSSLFHDVEVTATEVVESTDAMCLTFTLEVETNEEDLPLISKK